MIGEIEAVAGQISFSKNAMAYLAEDSQGKVLISGLLGEQKLI